MTFQKQESDQSDSSMQSIGLRISAIVPAFNRSTTLRKCIESLLCQSLDPTLYEVIVVDNNSTDDTREVVSRYLKLPRYNLRYVLEPQPGLVFTRHAGAKAANSEILAFTDDDAICDSRWLEGLLAAFKDATIGCVGGKIIVEWDRAPPEWVIPYEPWLGKLDYGPQPRILENRELINGGNLAIRKEVLWSVGGFNPDQVGEVLIGDGEVGLYNKLRQAGIKMAWVPDSIVWHLQTVAKNATLSDLRRRFSNTGISQAYSNCQKSHPTSLPLVRAAISSLLNAFTFQLRAYMFRLTNVTKRRQNDLTAAFYRGQASQELKLALKKQLREDASKQNWLD